MHSRTKAAGALGAVVALLLSSGCSLFDKDEAPKPTGTANVTAEGSAHTLENVTITVAPNTVSAPTNLTVTTPAPKPDDSSLPFGGLNAPNVQFDISLAGDVQPLQPLDVKIPLTGKFLPNGAKPEHALLYSPNEAGEWRLVPSIVENGVLHAKVAHLSPKHITYATPTAIFQAVAGDLYNQAQQSAGNCEREYGSGADKVTLGGSGWEKSANSVVHPCLTKKNGKLSLKITNNSAIMWSVATSGPQVNADSGSTEVEMIKAIAKILPHDKNLKAFLAEDDDAVVEIDNDALPATVQMRADAVQFLAQAIWISVKFGVGVFSGKSGDGVIRLANEVMKTPELIDCVADVFKSTANNKFDAFVIVRTLLSACGEKIGRLLEAAIPPLGWWEKLTNTFFTVVDGIATAVKTIDAAVAGVMQQIKGDVTITVKSVAPPKPPCATLASFKEAVHEGGATVVSVDNIKCSNGWAYGGVNFDEAHSSRDALRLIHYENGSWKWVTTMNEPIYYGGPGDEKAVALCKRLPSDFRKELCVKL